MPTKWLTASGITALTLHSTQLLINVSFNHRTIAAT
jgi:hypothetical protein